MENFIGLLSIRIFNSQKEKESILIPLSQFKLPMSMFSWLVDETKISRY